MSDRDRAPQSELDDHPVGWNRVAGKRLSRDRVVDDLRDLGEIAHPHPAVGTVRTFTCPGGCGSPRNPQSRTSDRDERADAAAELLLLQQRIHSGEVNVNRNWSSCQNL